MYAEAAPIPGYSQTVTTPRSQFGEDGRGEHAEGSPQPCRVTSPTMVRGPRVCHAGIFWPQSIGRTRNRSHRLNLFGRRIADEPEVRFRFLILCSLRIQKAAWRVDKTFGAETCLWNPCTLCNILTSPLALISRTA